MKLAYLIVAGLVLSAAAPALAGLSIELELERGTVEFQAPVTWIVRLVNRGETEVRYFEPDDTGLDPFPSVRIVREGDERELIPYNPPCQSMATEGIQGSIVRLAPGESKEYRKTCERFLAVDRRSQKADWHEPRRLPDGEYRIRAVYEQPDTRVPYDTGGFDVELKEVEGIFTGRIEAEPVTLRVAAPSHPHLRITVPVKGETGVRILFANPTSEAHVFAGPAAFVLSSKMYGSARAPISERELRIVVPAGGKVEKRVDLRALSWHRTGTESVPPEGLGGIVPDGLCHLAFGIAATPPVKADGIWVRIPEVENRGLEGIVVSASLPAATVRAGETVPLTVHVENRGDEAVGLVHRLSFPRELLIRIDDATGARPSAYRTSGRAPRRLTALMPREPGFCKLADGLAWNRDRFEPAPGLTRKDLIWIEPDAGIVKELDLTGLLATGLTPGRYLIRAGYRNVESGARLGYAPGHRAGTGVVWSEPVALTVE